MTTLRQLRQEEEHLQAQYLRLLRHPVAHRSRRRQAERLARRLRYLRQRRQRLLRRR